jgi:hypothetical protein
VLLLGSLPVEPAPDGTLKSCGDGVLPVPLAALATDGAGSLGALVLLLVLPPEGALATVVLLPVLPPGGALATLVLPPLVAELVELLDGATKLMPLDDPVDDAPGARLPGGIAALSLVAAAPSEANRPELYAVADGLVPAPTSNVAVPSLEISHGAPEVGWPPLRLMPMT